MSDTQCTHSICAVHIQDSDSLKVRDSDGCGQSQQRSLRAVVDVFRRYTGGERRAARAEGRGALRVIVMATLLVLAGLALTGSAAERCDGEAATPRSSSVYAYGRRTSALPSVVTQAREGEPAPYAMRKSRLGLVYVEASREREAEAV